jgi:uncharacterized protein (DUF433 family)
MNSKPIRIVDLGRGPQIEGHRLTLMDVFYYLHRGRDFDYIHRALPSLTRPEFDAVVQYVNEHRQELADKDRLVDERIKERIADQKARGLNHEIDDSISIEQRAARLQEKLRRRLKQRADEDGSHATGRCQPWRPRRLA